MDGTVNHLFAQKENKINDTKIKRVFVVSVVIASILLFFMLPLSLSHSFSRLFVLVKSLARFTPNTAKDTIEDKANLQNHFSATMCSALNTPTSNRNSISAH